ncbi:DUF222 domain-containing protein [Kytococcus sedentarius]|uniref:HNH endonuclease signature motif containing protein n=1 Tax=Kytococcus sedentarius TaxID=1276 RepID=UPI0035BBC8A2
MGNGTIAGGPGKGALAGEQGNGAPEGGTGRSATGRALDAGDISKAHAAIIVKELDRLPDTLSPADRERVEEALVASATRLNPASFRRAARRCLDALEVPQEVVDAHEDQGVSSEERRAWDKARFSIRHGQDGRSTGYFVVPTLQGRMIEKVVGAMVSPTRRRRPGMAEPAGDGPAGAAAGGGPAGASAGAWPVGDTSDHGVDHGADARAEMRAQDEIDWQHERGKALAELFERMPVDHLGHKVTATVVVHTDLETLRGEVARSGRTDVGEKVSAGQLRRIAAEANLIPSVLGGPSLPLDLGTQKRFFTINQRLALSTIYSECAAAGCDRPFSWCQIHHDRPWAARRGSPEGDPQLRGPTDLANAIPLCGPHNRAVEAPGVTHRVERDSAGVATVHFEDPAPSRASRGLL